MRDTFSYGLIHIPKLSQLWVLFMAFIAVITFINISAAEAKVYIVDQNSLKSSDDNPGTEELPLKTLDQAGKLAQSGDTVRIKRGVYREPLVPRNSGQEGMPIVFEAYSGDEHEVWIKGSNEIRGWGQEGKLWVKRPWETWSKWLGGGYIVEWQKAAGEGPLLYVNGIPLKWVKEKKDIESGSFWWAEDGSELVVCPGEGINLNQELVEIPRRDKLLTAWPGVDIPRGTLEKETLQRQAPQRLKGLHLPQIDYIHVKGLCFSHSQNIGNRGAVAVEGDHWVLENNIVEWTDKIGILAESHYTTLRGNITRFNGQNGISGGGENVVMEGNILLWDNEKNYNPGWGGAASKFAAYNRNWIVRNNICLGHYGGGIWFDIDCVDNLIEENVVIGNRKVNGGSGPGYFYEISWNGMIRNNVAFAHYASGKGTYGGGVVISDSSNTCAEGNVIIGGDGGLSLLQGIRGDEHKDEWFCKDNIFRDNLIVSPRTFVIWVRDHLQFQPTEEKNNNRFIRNVVIKGGYGTGFINWGEDEYADIIELDQAVPQVEGSQQYESLGQVKGEDKVLLDKALGRVLGAIGRIEPRLRFLSREPVSLEDIWSFGKGRGDILGFWVRYKDGRVLLLDAEKEGLIELLVGTGDKRGGVELWDFGREQALKGLHPVNLVSKDGMIKGEIRGSFGLICGLPVSTKPLEIIKGWAEVEGKEVRNLVEGQTFDIALEISNPWNEEVRYNLKGPGIKDNTISLRTGEKKKISLRENASISKTSFSYQISSDRLPEKEFEISLRIDKPVEIPCHKIEADGDSKKYIFSALFKIDKKSQVVPEIYDPKIGVNWEGLDDLSAEVKALLDDKALYLWVEVKDNVVKAHATIPWDGDGIEIFLDGRKERLGEKVYTPGVYQLFFFAPEKEEWSELRWDGTGKKKIMAKGKKVERGYHMEIVIPWDLFPELRDLIGGEVMGFDIAVDDTDGEGYRTAQMVWHGTGKNHADASLFGRIRLTPPPPRLKKSLW